MTHRRAKRPSMADVARSAGVSPQTVSRVSNGARYVSEDKRDRVLAAMHSLGYRPNSAARAMRSGEFRNIGVVYASLHPVGNHRSLESISAEAARRGYATTLMPVDAETHRAADGAFTRLGEMAVDAVVAIIPSEFADDGSWRLPPGLPGVVLGPPLFAGATTLDFDQKQGTLQVVSSLLDLGHRTVHHIGGPVESYSARARESAWREALRLRGCPLPEVIRGDWSPQSGYLAANLLFDTAGPTAVFAANDQMALGVYRAANERGLSIPGDLSVVGFDDIDEAAAFPPPLTTVVQDWSLIGRKALDATLNLLAGEEPEHTVLETFPVYRESTAGPAQ